MKIIVRFLILILVPIGCSNPGNGDNVIERKILESFNANFSKPYEVIDTLSAIEIFQKIENYFIFIGVLRGTNPNDYELFMINYINNSPELDLKCLYQNYPSVEFALFPSNIAYIWSVYDLQAKPNQDEFSKIVQLIESTKDGYNIKFSNNDEVINYLKTIDPALFSEKIVYRIPLIVFSLSEIDKNR